MPQQRFIVLVYNIRLVDVCKTVLPEFLERIDICRNLLHAHVLYEIAPLHANTHTVNPLCNFAAGPVPTPNAKNKRDAVNCVLP